MTSQLADKIIKAFRQGSFDGVYFPRRTTVDSGGIVTCRDESCTADRSHSVSLHTGCMLDGVHFEGMATVDPAKRQICVLWYEDRENDAMHITIPEHPMEGDALIRKVICYLRYFADSQPDTAFDLWDKLCSVQN